MATRLGLGAFSRREHLSVTSLDVVLLVLSPGVPHRCRLDQLLLTPRLSSFFFISFLPLYSKIWGIFFFLYCFIHFFFYALLGGPFALSLPSTPRPSAFWLLDPPCHAQSGLNDGHRSGGCKSKIRVAGGSVPGKNMLPGWWMAVSSLSLHVAGGVGPGSPVSLLTRAPVLLDQGLPSRPCLTRSFPKAGLPNTAALGAGAPACASGRAQTFVLAHGHSRRDCARPDWCILRQGGRGPLRAREERAACLSGLRDRAWGAEGEIRGEAQLRQLLPPLCCIV